MLKIKMLPTVMLSSLLTMSLMAGCGTQGQTTPGTNNNQGQAAGQTSKANLVMATSADYPPYESHNTTNGDVIEGFDIDIANQIAKTLNFNLKVTDMDFNGLIPALQAKRADFVMAGMTPTADRQKNVDFSIVYYEAKNTIVAKKGSNLKNTSDLSGKKVGVQLGSIQEGDAKKIPGIQLVSLNKIPEIIQELKSNRIDAAIIEDTVAKGYTAANPDLEFNTVPNTEAAGSAVAFPKGSKYVDQFNKVLQQMKENGDMDKLINKWFAK